MRSTLLLCVALLWAGLAAAQDDNWGVKVKCYVVEGEVVCPGCGQRAGLSCPRFDADRNRICGQATPPPVVEEENTPECDEAATETKAPVVTTSKPKSSTPLIQTELDLMKNETWRQAVLKDVSMRTFLYRILQPYGRRQKREVSEELEEGTCRWNGDCPCPQICCRAGEGCPRRCKMGIRLPPPWGKR
ncbi:unnamed protein product [Larinioides sclopetarius]|uniref:Uncharacterized protein n=1 Tax=Larinioides sclopetarius TaxID=280406 RepID=A0AAV2A717_9ARAC